VCKTKMVNEDVCVCVCVCVCVYVYVDNKGEMGGWMSAGLSQ
jgi:hypothetical protein